MKKLLYILGATGLFAVTSCTDHEVIPPPVPAVALDCECDATINDSLVSYSENCQYYSTKNIVSGGGVSSAQYISKISDEATVGSLEIEMRSINWIDEGSNNPSLNEWKSFFEDNPSPNYSDNLDHPGVAIRWVDPNGNLWVNDTSEAICIQDFVYNTLIQESDTTGAYIKYDATFSCKLINSDYGVVDSVKCLENAHMRSAFKLE